MNKFYAVKKGRKTGIFNNWEMCSKQVNGYRGAIYKSFKYISDAKSYLSGSSHKKRINLVKKKISMRSTTPTHTNTITKYPISQRKNNSRYIFVDGSYRKIDQQYVGGYGIYFGHNHPYNLSCRVKNPTNNICELMAILNTLIIIDKNQADRPFKSNLDDNPHFIIVSDSKYCIKCVTEWYKAWIKNGWVTSKKSPVKNKDLIIKITDLLDKLPFDIQFKHQRSHQTTPHDIHSFEYFLWRGNDMADKLARGDIKPNYLQQHKDHTTLDLLSDENI
tara:strand:+ start:596 stop:1423 length:828 start_codon:yes stop_codon:yes gene_type:complete